MHCPYCGRSLGDGQHGRCPSCGLPIPAAPPAVVPASPTEFAAAASAASDAAEAAPSSAPEAGGFPADLIPEIAASAGAESTAAMLAPDEVPAEPPAVSEPVVGMESGGAAYVAPAAPSPSADVPASTADAMPSTPQMPAAPAFAPAAFEPPAVPPVAESAVAAPLAPESAPASVPPAAEQPTFGVPPMSQPSATPEQPSQPPAAPAQSQPAALGAYPPGYPYPAPAQGQPLAPGYPQYGYGQPAAPSYPMYGQPAAPSYPMYGQPAPGSVPMMPAYGQPAPGSVPFYPQPGMMPLPPARKTNVGLIVGIVALVVVLVIAAIGGVLALRFVASPALSGPPPGAAVAAATATPAENVIYHDSLTSGAPGWSKDSHCSPQADGYHVKDGYDCFAPVGELTDGSLEVDVKQVAGELDWFYGLSFRHVSQGNLYGLFITSNGYWEFGKDVDGKFTRVVPYVLNPAVHTGLGATNTLKLVAEGSHFTFFINGAQVGHADDSTFTRGSCGILGNGQGGVEVVFTNITIATLS